MGKAPWRCQGAFSLGLIMRIPYLIALAVLFVGALAVAIYWPGLHGAFFFDDLTSIVLPEGVRLETLSLESMRQALASGYSGPFGRPVAQLSFALNYYFSGFDPFAFKATNLVIHFACGILVFGLSLRLLAAARPQAKHPHILIASGVVAGLWLLHPIQLLPVLHVVQRMTSLSALFLLAALLLHIRGRECSGRAGVAMLFLAWAVLWPLSIFSKETGLLFPVFVLAWELVMQRAASGRLDRFARGYAALSGVAALVVLAYLCTPYAHWLWSGYDMRPFTPSERLLTEGRILWFYLGLIVAPRLDELGLYHDDIAVSSGLLMPWTTTFALLGLFVLASLAWRWRERAPIAAFGLAWFLIGHAMESTFLPLELAHEHRNYLPLFGILLAAGWALLLALENVGVRKTLGITLAFAAFSYCVFVTALRANQFGEEGRRTQIEAQHHRLSARAQFEAGAFLAGLPDAAVSKGPMYAFARKHLELANRLNPDFKMGLLELIQLNCTAGIPVVRAELEELSRRLQETPFAPADRNVLYSAKEMSIAGTLCLTRPDMQALFFAAFANPTVSPSVVAMLYSWYADYLLLQQDDLMAAKGALSKSLQLAPTNSSNRLKWAQLVLLEGHREEAAQLLRALENARLSSSEKTTAAKLLACLEGDVRQCGKI